MFGGNAIRPNMTKYKVIIPLNPLYFNRNPYILFYRLFTKTALKNVKTAQNGETKWAAAYAAAHFVVGKKYCHYSSAILSLHLMPMMSLSNVLSRCLNIL